MNNYQLAKKQSRMNSSSDLIQSQTELMPSNSMMLKAMDTIDHLNPNEGITKTLPDALKGRLESHFGHSIDNLSFKESSDVSSIGAKAYAKGNVIKFAPGQFNPESKLGQKMIAHEIEHVKQQASGVESNVIDGVNYNPQLESAADRAGDNFLAGNSTSANLSHANLSPIPTVSAEAAPMQGWGAGGLLSWIGGKTKLRKGEHEELTRTAGNLADARSGHTDYADEAKSLKKGSRFNDVYHSNSGISFGLKYTLHNDAFVNQSHHGDMQFLHSMSNGDSATENKAKALRWAEFCIDTSQNKDDFQNKNMLEYVLGADNTFQDMMLSTMLGTKTFGKNEEDLIEDELNSQGLGKENIAGNPMLKAERQQARRQLMINRLTNLDAKEQAKYDKILAKKKNSPGSEKHDAKIEAKAAKYREKALASHRSKYANSSIGNFFTNGKSNLDAGMVATGSLSHMLEDSVASSHGQRLFNTRTNAGFGNVDIANANDVLATLTPVMLHANYDEQDESRHGKADFMNVNGMSKKSRFFGHGRKYQQGLQDSINRTEGARQGQLMAAHIMHGLSTGESKESMQSFLSKALAVDENALKLQEISKLKTQNPAVNAETIANITAGTDLEGLDFANLNISTTQSGRQYQKGGLDSDEADGAAENLKNAASQYETLLDTQERGNTAYSTHDKINHYRQQLQQLINARNAAQNLATRQKIVQHMTEMLLNLSGMKKQLHQGLPNQDVNGLLKDVNDLLQDVKDAINACNL